MGFPFEGNGFVFVLRRSIRNVRMRSGKFSILFFKTLFEISQRRIVIRTEVYECGRIIPLEIELWSSKASRRFGYDRGFQSVRVILCLQS